ncbi:MAG: Stp1/IreP family PP2C-type Ser/Thr phosphatase [Egibacteraceae bacterium]
MTGLRFTVHAATDKGRVREGNEDSHYAGSTVFAVADGMGGHVAGEVASQRALEPVEELNGSQFAAAEDAQRALVDAITQANRSVIADAAADPGLSGMGTTLTAVMVRNGRLHLAHVGDSRAYLLRSGDVISQLTTDHTLVEQLIREGRIARDEAATHPQRSVVTRAIGVDREVEVDSLAPLELQPGDQVVLCSDGLTNPVGDDEIAGILEAEADGDAATSKLITMANERGGPDNITVVLLRVLGPREHDGSRVPAVPATADATQPVGDTGGGGGEDQTTGRLDGSGLRPPVRTSEGATPIRTRQESGDDADWATKMGRYGEEQGSDVGHTPAPRARRRGRALGVVVGVLVLLGVLGAGGYALLARAYFVGDSGGQIGIYNGLPPDSVGGLRLSWQREATDLSTDDLPAFLASRVRDGVSASSLTEAREIVESYRVRIEEASAPEPEPEPSPSPTATPADEASPSPAASPDS